VITSLKIQHHFIFFFTEPTFFIKRNIFIRAIQYNFVTVVFLRIINTFLHKHFPQSFAAICIIDNNIFNVCNFSEIMNYFCFNKNSDRTYNIFYNVCIVLCSTLSPVIPYFVCNRVAITKICW
jgi:hypothetical protein